MAGVWKGRLLWWCQECSERSEQDSVGQRLSMMLARCGMPITKFDNRHWYSCCAYTPLGSWWAENLVAKRKFFIFRDISKLAPTFQCSWFPCDVVVNVLYIKKYGSLLTWFTLALRQNLVTIQDSDNLDSYPVVRHEHISQPFYPRSFAH